MSAKFGPRAKPSMEELEITRQGTRNELINAEWNVRHADERKVVPAVKEAYLARFQDASKRLAEIEKQIEEQAMIAPQTRRGEKTR